MEGSRITSGNIIRAARVLQATHRVTERAVDSLAVRAAIRSLEGPGLEAHATRLEPADDWSRVAVSPETLTDLVALAARCRQREQLGAFAGKAFEQLGPGVRALFKGPSGSGKTLAARTLAGVLGMDLWSIQLASIVSRYVGDSTKSLERVFACAEELDIILLLDEGDALLTRRTAVENSTDKYANLETNYLLQRLESYAGIIVVTTNAPDRIDAAFQRRMDVVIDFALPDAGERLAIWQLHLPPDHEVGLDQLHTVAQRCVLSGGQIRNVALHASLLALEGHARVGGAHLEAAIEREYRKLGAMSPVRTRNGTA
jgi:SpoVK/Ycf46/Vps4 family AAA+-type ATPase